MKRAWQAILGAAWLLAAPPAGAAAPVAAPATSPVDQAVALRQAGQFDQAAKLLLQWLGDHPEDARARTELGVLYALHGQLRPALDQFGLAVQADPKLRAARWNLAETLRADERCTEALPHYAKLVEDDPRDGPPYKGQVLCGAILGQWDAALAACDLLGKRFPGTSLGKWADSQRDRIAQMRAGGAPTVGQMEAEGKQLFAEKRYADAAVWLAAAAAQEPSADRHYRHAMALLGAQDLLGCQAALDRAIKLDSNHQPARMAMATVARALRNFGSGAADIGFDKLDETIERALARALADSDGVVARQLAQLVTSAKDAKPFGAVAYLLAGEVLLRDGQAAKALELFDKAVKAKANHDAARKASADAMVQLGRYADARKLAQLPPPPPHVADNADLPVFVRQRRIEFTHQLKMMLDPGVRPLPAIVDLVAGDLPLPPPPAPPPPAPPPPTKGKGAKQKAGNQKAGNQKAGNAK